MGSQTLNNDVFSREAVICEQASSIVSVINNIPSITDARNVDSQATNVLITESQENNIIHDESLQADGDEGENDYPAIDVEVLITEQNDLASNVLTDELICKLKPGRRSSNMKTLLKEEFTKENDNKRPSFYTDVPLKWYEALREYSTLNDLGNRLELIKNKKNLITRCVLHTVSDNKKHLVITINFVTGILILQGPSANEWIENEFLKVSELACKRTTHNSNTCMTTNESETTTANDENVTQENKSPETETTTEKVKKTQKAPIMKIRVSNDSSDSNTEKLWEECATLRKSVGNLQNELLSLSTRYDETIALLKSQKEQFSSQLLSLRTAYDNKLTVFMSTSSIDCSDKNKATKNSINKDLASHKKTVSRIDSNVQKSTNRINDFISNHKGTNETLPKWRDLQRIEESTQQTTQKLQSSIEKVEEQINIHETKIESMKSFPTGEEQPKSNIESNIQFLLYNLPLLKTEINNTTHKVTNEIDVQLRKDSESITKNENDIKRIERDLAFLRTELFKFSKTNTQNIRSNPVNAVNLTDCTKETPPTFNNANLSMNAACFTHYSTSNSTNYTPTPLMNTTFPPNYPTTSQPSNGITRDDRENNTHDTPKTPAKLLVCMDSNRKFLDPEKFWRTNGTVWRKCPNLRDIKRVMSNEEFSGLEVILVHCGVNDIDFESGQEIFQEIQKLTSFIRSKYPQITIILSEITPRTDERDAEGIKCNKLLESYASSHNIILVEHQNLRDDKLSMWYETKHIKQLAVPKFAANLKIGLREAFKIPSRHRNFHNKMRGMADHTTYSQQSQPNDQINNHRPDVRKRMQPHYKQADQGTSYEEVKRDVISQLIHALSVI